MSTASPAASLAAALTAAAASATLPSAIAFSYRATASAAHVSGRPAASAAAIACLVRAKSGLFLLASTAMKYWLRAIPERVSAKSALSIEPAFSNSAMAAG